MIAKKIFDIRKLNLIFLSTATGLLILVFFSTFAKADAQIILEWAHKIKTLGITSASTYEELADQKKTFNNTLLEVREEIRNISKTGRPEDPFIDNNAHLLPDDQIQALGNSLSVVNQLVLEQLFAAVYSKNESCATLARIFELYSEIQLMDPKSVFIEVEAGLAALQLLLDTFESRFPRCSDVIANHMPTLKDMAHSVTQIYKTANLIDNSTDGPRGRDARQKGVWIVIDNDYNGNPTAEIQNFHRARFLLLCELFSDIEIVTRYSETARMANKIEVAVSSPTHNPYQDLDVGRLGNHHWTWHGYRFDTDLYPHQFNDSPDKEIFRDEIKIELLNGHMIANWMLPHQHLFTNKDSIIKRFKKRAAAK